ncbi:MAG: 2-C-methyl-D-erythritol 4-phosphate cytidylyltransferase [Chloroflexi bacterium]|nr:2-C-methyl-D-erythritol 4-phosphate cytidylyltransferase [Chloroflexota bacterium]
MAGTDKIFTPLLKRPLISYSLSVMNDSPQVSSIVLVVSPKSLERGRRLVRSQRWAKLRDVCAGGERRQDSVRMGLERLPECEWVIVHDGARPLLEAGMICTGLRAARTTGAAVAAVPVKDTIKMADADDVVTQTIERDRLWAVQTPQVFRRKLLVEAHRSITQDVTDDASMAELMGASVKVFMGSYDNLKVTTPDDLTMARSVLASRRRRASGGGR